MIGQPGFLTDDKTFEFLSTRISTFYVSFIAETRNFKRRIMYQVSRGVKLEIVGVRGGLRVKYDVVEENKNFIPTNLTYVQINNNFF